MIQKTILIIAVALSTSSCVSKKVFTALEDNYTALKKDHRALETSIADYEQQTAQLTDSLTATQQMIAQLNADKAALATEIATAQAAYVTLEKEYADLEKNSASELVKKANKNKALLAELSAKEADLLAENNRLLSLQKELDSRSKRVDELEAALVEKDAHMRSLKDAISKALTNFEGKGLTVEQRNGKVYVSMENKLLFNSGSWTVGAEGRQAVTQLGEVLADNPEINVLIEGHTDNDAFRGRGDIKNNWDLSTKRATAIVAILQENKLINTANLTAAGRSEYAPIATNESTKGKSKNRRIEIILTPKLDAISALLSND